jgi:hypothetical protein
LSTSLRGLECVEEVKAKSRKRRFEKEKERKMYLNIYKGYDSTIVVSNKLAMMQGLFHSMGMDDLCP